MEPAMKRFVESAFIICLICPAIAAGQARSGLGNHRSESGERTHPAQGVAQPAPSRPAPGAAHLERTGSPTARYDRAPFHGPEMGGPITQAVDLPQPIPAYIPVPMIAYAPMEVTAGPMLDAPYEVPAQHHPRTIFATRLGNCIDDPEHAGFCFVRREVVSCEDSTVDFYLSVADSGNYALIAPHDTDIKDAGYRMHVLDVVTFRPKDWAPEHMVRIEGGHVYIVWTNAGEFYLVRVNSIERGKAAIEWAYHSRLPRDVAERRQEKESVAPIPVAEPPERDRGERFPR
jgi:hypothetical protein